MESWLRSGLLLISLALETSMALNPGCVCLLYTDTYGMEFGRFSTPDYPRSYSDNINCILYTFIAGPTEIVEISFKHFDLNPTSEDCSYGDYLRVYLELDSAHVSELSPVSGVLCSALPTLPHLLYSSGSVLVLEFHTSRRPRNTNYSGFLGTFRFIDTSQYVESGEVPDNCEYYLMEPERKISSRFPSSSTVSISPNHLYSPRYPASYPKNIRCTYIISARKGGRVKLLFEELDLQKGDISCLLREDVVRIHDGDGPLSPVITFLCNQGTNSEIISSTESLFLEFTSSSIWPGHGFKAVYYFVHDTDDGNALEANRGGFGPAVSATRPGCDLKITSNQSKNGTITSPGFPGPYPPKTTCQYEFVAKGRERIQLIFTDFSLFVPNELPKDCIGADNVVSFVMLDNRMEKIDTYCGLQVPKAVMSNGPRLIVRFTGTHSSRHARGFRAKYAFVTNYGIQNGEQVDDYPCAFRYRAGLSLEGVFTSPNFPGLYPRETECHYFFHGSDNHRVRIIFHYFDVEGIHPCDVNSASDYVEFSNFMGLDRKYTRQCGHINSGMVVESERKFFRVTFRSNDRLDATGFNATYQFVEPPTRPPAIITARSSGIRCFLVMNLFMMMCMMATGFIT